MFKNKEYILTVLEEGSFTAGAEKLYISQPSLSASIKRIEAKIGAPIFNRTTPVTLTEAGKMYVKYATEIEQKEKEFEKYIKDTANLSIGTVRIGGSSLMSSFVLPDIISDFSKKHPKIRFEIFENNTDTLLKKLESGALDIIIDDVLITDDGISPTAGMSETLLLAVPKELKINEKMVKYRLSSDDIKNNKHLEDEYKTEIEPFSKEQFILLNPENGTGKRAEKIFKNHRITPDVCFYLDQQITAYNTASRGLGITFVGDTLIKNISKNDDLYFYVLSDEEIKRNIYFYVKSNRYLSLACSKFLEYNFVKTKK